ncbi:MAG: Tim44 domain-containing protein [PS1 clade bacterium]|nr:Tim44 domain-containing protein [PS1 clade bacterium]MBL6783952.1 Tim44 domain-containing protein [PS1 clade bacterium]
MDPLNLILLIMVALIGWRLRSVLGTRNDDEKPSSRADAYRLNRNAYENPPAPRQDNEREVIKAADVKENGDAEKAASTDTGTDMAAADAPEQGEIATSDATDDAPQMGRGLAYLRGIDPDFDEGGFLDGAGRAYEMILSAFAAGDLSDVRGFLGDDVASGFDAAIGERQTAGQKLETRILRLDRPALEDAEVDGEVVRLDVRFRAEIMSAIYAADTVLDEDNLPAPTTTVDVWSFEGAHSAANAGWTLVATRAG